MGFTMDMLVMCHNFRTILHIIFGQTYAYFVGTLPSIRKPKDPPGGLQVQVPPQFYEQLHLPDPTTIRLNLIPHLYEVTVSDSMVEYPVIGGVILINKSKQNQFLRSSVQSSSTRVFPLWETASLWVPSSTTTTSSWRRYSALTPWSSMPLPSPSPCLGRT